MNPGVLHHVGIVVPDEAQVQVWVGLFGLELGRRHYVPQYEAECVFVHGPRGLIEFIIPRGGVLAKFNKGVGGLHHVAFEVEDLAEETRRLAEQGIELLEAQPVRAGPILINFVAPVYTRGVTVELVQTIDSHAVNPDG